MLWIYDIAFSAHTSRLLIICRDVILINQAFRLRQDDAAVLLMETCLGFVREIDLFVTSFLCTLIVVFVCISTNSLGHVLASFLWLILILRLVSSINSTHSVYSSATYGICLLILY